MTETGFGDSLGVDLAARLAEATRRADGTPPIEATRAADTTSWNARKALLRPSRLDMSGRSGWEYLPGVVARPLLALILGTLGVGMNLLSRFDKRVRAQITRTMSFEISTADGVRRRWMFDSATRRITSTRNPTGDADHRVHFRSSAQGVGVLTSTRTIDSAVDGLVRHRIQVEGSAFIVIWFYGLARRVVKIGRTRGPRQPIPDAYVCPDASRDGPETIVREPAVTQLDPTWRAAWNARATLCIIRGPAGEPVTEP